MSDTGASGEQAYSTLGFRGTASLRAISAYNASLGPDSYTVSLQLNAFLSFRYGGTTIDYWVQDVLELDTLSRLAYFEDNIWNASSPGNSSIATGALLGNGSIATSSGGDYYAFVASAAYPGSDVTLTYPTTVAMLLNVSLNASGAPTVRFLYDDGFGYVVYDTVTVAYARSVTGFGGFSVRSSDLGGACPRCVDNVELVFGGPSGGHRTDLNGATNVSLVLDRWTGHNFASVPDADNHGESTAEALGGGTATLAGRPGTSPGALLTEGGFAPSALWRSSSLAGLRVSVGTGSNAGTATENGVTIPFVNGTVDLLLLPGVVNLTVTTGPDHYGLAALNLTAGGLLTEEVGAIAVVFVPQGLPASTVWTVILGNRTLSGTGSITFGVANGTYPFSILSQPGYTPNPSSGTVPINGSGYYQIVAWNAQPAGLLDQIESLLELGVGPVPLYAILAGILLLGIVSAYFGRRRGRRRRPSWDDGSW